MAALYFIARKNAISTGTALKTLLRLQAPAHQRVRLVEIGIAFHGVVATNEPIQVDLARVGTDGTMSTLTPAAADNDIGANGTSGTAIQTSCFHTATGEPTILSELETWAIHPQTGLVYPVPAASPIVIGGGTCLALQTTAANSVNADVYIKCEE